MKTSLRITLIAAAFAAGSAVADSTDRTSVRIVSNGTSETIDVPLSALKVGESRQLAAASGTPAIVTRTDSGLTIEMAGRSTEVKLPELNRIARSDGDGKRQVRIIRHDGGGLADGAGPRHTVFVQRQKGEGDPADIEEADLDALLSDIDVDVGTADTKVIVVHRRKKSDSTD
jgi:hypothetical protein